MFTFKVVDTEELLDETFRFRYKIMHDELKFIENNITKVDTDEYDEYSKHFAAFDNNGNLCAVVRVIFNSPIGYPTPTYMSTKLSIYENVNKNFAEFSRIFIAKDIRNIENSALIIINFLKLIAYYVDLYNVDYIYGALEKNFIRLLHRIKIDFHILGEASDFYGHRYPALLVWEELIKGNPDIGNIKTI